MFKRPIISAAELSELITQGHAPVLFDCRFNLADPDEGERAYRHNHLAGARYAHLDKNLSSRITDQSGRHPLPDRERFCLWLGEQGVDNSSWVVVYDDQQSLFASRLWWLLRWVGHERVAVLDGGYKAALEQGIAANDQEVHPEPKSFTAQTALESVVETAEILSLKERLQVLVDVRAAPRYRGEVEPMDPVAGHIPGAINLPMDLTLSEGCFMAPDELSKLFESYLPVNQSPVFMCGSGVTACHTRLAYLLAGGKDAAIYPGSWSQWIRDPNRPVEVGLDCLCIDMTV